MSTETATQAGLAEGASPRLKLGALTALVVGSMIGGGIFSLPQNMAAGAGAGAILIGWAITFVGMLALAFVFQMLASRKPEVSGGVYGYAKAGFGDYMGFNSAWGYWISAWIGNVSYFVVMFSALGFWVPAFGDGNTPIAIACASVVLWGLHFLVLRGVHGAAFINTVTTIAKLVPLALFILLIVFAFKVDTFNLDFWGSAKLGSIVDQVKSTMLVTVWVFIGIEGASMFSGRAESMKDVGKATVIGFLLTIALLVAVSVLSLGVMTQAELAALKNPSTAYVLQKAFGTFGANLMNAGLVISVGGALLAWTLLAAEAPYLAGKDGVMPKVFGTVNGNDTPAASLWLTNGLIQLFLLITLKSSAGYLALLSLATSMILIPYLLCAGYSLLVAKRGEGYAQGESTAKEFWTAALATLYGAWLIYAAGPKYLFLSMVLYAPGLLFYLWAKKEQGRKPFNLIEAVLAAIVVVMALIAVYMLATGQIGL
ncbi:arginine-ornithine antiporter [Chromobacterium vaccinii]|uniref:Arginine-ornithine antiporter n=3 Tax=Chromobacteriaceae TaxID=1499392 RepID=A0A1D9LG32_9NEIS|nr:MULTISPECIES: arginine-ornithine antiporter [Chromobacteriaceae]AOZ50249.1 arginine-ornithine antiporter [Chromobacterium vaccinii]ERE00073.1 amino acid APC transporter [Pseudogulbenkiania ferrooxidans EGD-HP2]MBX9297324.1 arginine-ornithine antiporter [Chromobacterium vaccinii]MBX9346251.1 arginine-ornithine antiporter [Chromobacterium vaccinii]MBX9355986.1 arginine-ornithine antiporter [Chromobacterium vaccinii]